MAMKMRQEKEYGGLVCVFAGGDGGALHGVRGGDGTRATGGGVLLSLCKEEIGLVWGVKYCSSYN